MVDKNYCMSSYLTFRYIVDEEKIFKEGMKHIDFKPVPYERQIACDSADAIERQIQIILEQRDLSKASILLSGGMDSAILASYMPKGTKAYTAKCSAPGAIDETERAKKYCELYGLEHVVVDITWEDYMEVIDSLMINDGCPISSNEPQIYKLAKIIKGEGSDLVIIGDNADLAFGGYNELISIDWDYCGWVNRYTYLRPEQVIKNPVPMNDVFEQYRIGKDGIDFIRFLNDKFSVASTGAYFNAFRNARLEYLDPYASMKMSKLFDLERIRSGDSKYLIRQLFKKRYPTLEVPEKIAMPRAVDQWMEGWNGPEREEFLPNCIEGMTGKQKFQVFALERFLDLIEE